MSGLALAIWVIWFAMFGGATGSFLNVVVYRMPRGESLLWPGSRCPACGHAIRAWDNVPVFGWLWLGGRCRDCRAPIAPRYAVVEAVTAALCGLVAWRVASAWMAPQFVGGGLPSNDVLLPMAAQVLYAMVWLSAGICAALIVADGQRLPQLFAWSTLLFLLIAPGIYPAMRFGAWYTLNLASDRPLGSLSLGAFGLICASPFIALLAATWRGELRRYWPGLAMLWLWSGAAAGIRGGYFVAFWGIVATIVLRIVMRPWSNAPVASMLRSPLTAALVAATVFVLASAGNATPQSTLDWIAWPPSIWQCALLLAVAIVAAGRLLRSGPQASSAS